MSYTYAQFQVALAIEMAVPNAYLATPTGEAPISDPQFNAILQTLIDQAEQRCYRDLDLLYATSAQTALLTVGSSKLDFSTLAPNLLIFEDMNLIVPATVTNPELGERVPVTPVSKEWLRAIYGVSSNVGPPEYYALLDDHTLLLGPFPDQPYTTELIGKFRPTPIYEVAPEDGSQTTFLASVLPDLFLAAAMVASTGYQHNWGAQSDDPRSALSWENSYQTALTSATSEENRKKFHGWMQMTSEKAPPPGTPGP
jgi:hypothetical protein